MTANWHTRDRYPDGRPGAHHLSRAEARARLAGRVCEICGNPAQANDHDHDTGRLRGLLCHRCNRVIGIWEENAEWMRAAADYLTRDR